jgi:hypothetical protein
VSLGVARLQLCLPCLHAFQVGVTGRGCSGVQVVVRVRAVVEAAAVRAARVAAIDAALVAAGQPVFANLGSLRLEAGVNDTMEPEQVRVSTFPSHSHPCTQSPV